MSKQLLKVKSRISGISLLCEDTMQRQFTVSTDREVGIGRWILVDRGILVGVVETDEPEIIYV